MTIFMIVPNCLNDCIFGYEGDKRSLKSIATRYIQVIDTDINKKSGRQVC